MDRRKEKVVINALQYSDHCSGIGVMLRELFVPFARLTDARCLVALPQDSTSFPIGDGAERITMPFSHRQNLPRMWFQTVTLGRRFCKNALLIVTDSKTPFFLPKSCELIPLVTDLALFRIPEAYKLSRVLWWKLQYVYIRRKAKQFMAISEFTKRDMTELLHIPPENITVVPCACAEQYRRVEDPAALRAVKEKYALPESYVLFVGNNNPRKNIDRLIRAFDAAKESGMKSELVIAGEQGWKFNKETALRGVRHAEDIHFIGFVPDDDMPALYSAAELFAFPTLYEGFGIPVLEAQSCGTPVLTSSCTSLPEIGGEGAVYVDPYDVASIAKGLLSVSGDPELAEALRAKGYENIKRFSWQKSAETVNEVVKKVLEK